METMHRSYGTDSRAFYGCAPTEWISGMHAEAMTDAYGNFFTGDMLDHMLDMTGDRWMNHSAFEEADVPGAVIDLLSNGAPYSIYDALRYAKTETAYPDQYEDPFEFEELSVSKQGDKPTASCGKRKGKRETAPAIHSMKTFIIQHLAERMRRELVKEMTIGSLAEPNRFVEAYEDTVKIGDMTFWRLSSRTCMASVKLGISVCESKDGREIFSDRACFAEILFDMTTETTEISIAYQPHCPGFDKPTLQSRWKLDDYLVPILDKEEIEAAAWALHCRYFPESKKKTDFTRDDFDAYELAGRMGLAVKRLSLHMRAKTKSLLFFCETPVLVDRVKPNGEKETEWVTIPANCIVINHYAVHMDDCQLEVFHECFHYDTHYLFYRLQEMGSNDLAAVRRVPITDRAQKQAKKSVECMEYQARRGSMGLMMPKPFIRPLTDKLIEQYAPDSRHAGELFERIIFEIRTAYSFAQFRIRARLIQLGYIEAKGAMNYANGKRIRAFAFERSHMDAGSTYVIDREELAKEYRTNGKFRHLIRSGNYVYADGHVCRNRPEWIVKAADGPLLSAWAEQHVDRCCLRFRSIYELNELSEYEFGRLACDDDYNKHYLNYIDRATLTPGAAFRQTRIFLDQLPQGFFAALDFIRNEKHISLEKLEELSHISRKKIDRERKKSKWSLTRDEVVALCVGLNMPPWLSKEMLKRAHIALDDYDPTDQMYSMILELYYMDSIDEVQEVLRQEGFEELALAVG